jgi:glycosyltransferase involved in cell wall biosynthesis
MLGELSGHRIVHVLTTIRHGGAERVGLDLAREQRALGADASVICLQELGELLPAFEAAGVPVRRLAGGPGPGVLRTAWRLARLLRELDPTVVHTHNGAPQIAAGLGQRLRHWRRAGTTLIHTEHGRLHDTRPALLQLRRWTAGEFDAIVAVSADARAQLLDYGIHGASGVDVIANGVDVARFGPPTTGRATPAFQIVHVGRLDAIKGQDVLLAAMPAIRHAIPQVRLTIVGDGPTRAQLEIQTRSEGIDDIVEFVGAAMDIRPYLRSANLFVLPSRSEGISLALLEAMASGVPVLATDVGGNREVIGSDEFGTLVPAEQPALLAQGAITLLQCPDLATRRGIAAQRQVQLHFGIERTVSSYASYYHRARTSNPANAVGSAP